MVVSQNKLKPENVQHVLEPDGMIDIDLKTNINSVIEINKKKLHKRRSCFKKLVFTIPIGILVITSALLLLRTYLNNQLNKPLFVKEPVSTFKNSEIIFPEENNLPSLELVNIEETITNEEQSKVKRDLKSSTDTAILLKSTSEHNDQISTLSNLNEMNITSTPSFLYFLSFYKGNHTKTLPSSFPNKDDNHSPETITPNLNSEATESISNVDEGNSIINFSTDKLTTELDQPFTELNSISFDSKIESSTISTPYVSDENKSTIDFSDTVKYSTEFDLEPFSDNSISQTSTPKSDQYNFNENNKPEIEVTSSSLNENDMVEPKELYQINQGTKNLAKTVPSNVYSTSKKESNFYSDVTESLSNFDNTDSINNVTTDKLSTELDQLFTDSSSPDTSEAVIFYNNESITQFPTINSDKIVLNSDNLKIETNSASTIFIPDKTESTIGMVSSNDSISQTLAPKSDQTEFEKFSLSTEAGTYDENLTKTVTPNLPKFHIHQAKQSNFNTETTKPMKKSLSAEELSAKINQLFTKTSSTTFDDSHSNKLKSTTEKNTFDQTTTDVSEETTFYNIESTTQFSDNGLEIETSPLPDENESTINYSTEAIILDDPWNSVENNKFHHIVTAISNETELEQSMFPQELNLNNTEETQIESMVGNKENVSLFDNSTKLKISQYTKMVTESTTNVQTTSKSDVIGSYTSNWNKKLETKIPTTIFNVTDLNQNNVNLETETSAKNTLSNLDTNAHNSIKVYTKDSEEKATLQTENPADQSTVTTNEANLENQTNAVNRTSNLLEDNFEDNNETSSSNLLQDEHNDTDRNLQLSRRIANDLDNLLGMTRRSTTMNQQVFTNKNIQFQQQSMNNNNNNNNNNWQQQEFPNFEEEKNKAQEPTAPGLQIQTISQNPIPNQNNLMTVCPSGVKILQQSSGYPFSYNFPSLYQNILPLSSPAYNPYMGPQYPYPGGNNFPPFYNNPTFQLGGYRPNNFYGDNSLSNGQYYICSSLSSNPYIQTVPEIRKRNDFILQKTNNLENSKNETRSVGECPFGEYRCNDGSKCIKRNQYCDNAVHCKDMSDELECSCIARIEKSRMCDGYLDCPDGEDESKCFGCDEDGFNCDDWTPQDRFSTCIPLDQRCNGVVNCPNAKDEENCSVLTEYFSTEQNFLVTYAKGYLYRNVRGKWYPVCRNPEIWANEACQLDGGGSYMSPLTHLIQTNINYRGPYVNMSPRGQLHFDNNCAINSAVFVECPLLVCGTRVKSRNYYRREEVDTSAEQILTQSLNLNQNVKNVTDSGEDLLLGNSRVVGGKPSQPESWPWIVSIYRNGVFHCGGVLINEFWIVTAAHCVDKYWHYYFEIQAGLLRRYSYSPIVQTRVASHIIAHQSYDKMKLKNDIALINLNNPVRYNRYVRPICLPSETTAGQNFMRNPQPNTICSAIGWGATAEHGSDPDHLREVDVPVLKNCKYKEDREGHEICAGLREGGKDACQGDSGGPFLCQNPNVANQWYLAGIVSHGEGCARPNEPGVYTRVSIYLDWIYENMRSNVLQHWQPLNHCPGYTCKDTKRCIPKQRHCDRIVDCLYADDEIDCDRNRFSEIFKHAIIDNLLPRTGEEKSPSNQNAELDDNQNEQDNSEELNNILGKIKNSDISSELFETIALNNSFIENIKKNNSPFLCQKMLQTIDMSKRCDKVHDCEDASDEENCTCVDYLKYSHPETVCNSVIDCFDASDEQNCPQKCRNNEFYCYLSNVCIQSYKQCDGKQNCPSGEDELNCFALADSKTITLGVDSRPLLTNDGFVSFYHNGTWQIVCSKWNTTEGAQYATQICIYLGFHDYKNFYKYKVSNKFLTVIQNGKFFTPTEAMVSNNSCIGIKVGCSDTIDVKHDENVIINQSFDHFEFIPWNAEIYENGKYICSGALLEKEWVVTTESCFGKNYKLYSNYVAVLLGGRNKIYLNVRNIYEQVIRVVEYVVVDVSDIVLLRLEKKVTVSSYIRPLGLNVKQYNLKEKQVCVVVGRNASNHTELIYLKSRDTCTTPGFRCFTKDSEFNNSSCKTESITSWGGCVVCRSGRGWYPASVFVSHFGSCLKGNEMWPSIQYWKPNILKLMERTPFSTYPPQCDGFRCNLGECIGNYQVCDGIPHCRDGKDEEFNYCAKRVENCTATQSCECKPSELKCKNGKCVEKFRFCDQVNDCGDWSDEPVKCDCRSYLEVTNPEKLCDGVRNCRDRTDENAYICKCSENKFRCKESNLCVSQEVVCDQISDCPNGEDESYCIELVNSSEVQIRTAGLWHPGCFAEHLTTLQLEDICEHLGYIGSSALRNTTVQKTGGRPVMDPFIGILINRINNEPLIIAKREGDKPYITFQEDYNCYRLFLNCL